MVAERKVGPRGKVVSAYLSFDVLDLIDRVGEAFGISRSDVLDSIVESKREELEEAIAQKTASLSGGT